MTVSSMARRDPDHAGLRPGEHPCAQDALPQQHGLYSNKLALITSNCGKLRYLSIKWP